MGKRRDVVCGLCHRTVAYTAAVHSKTTGKHYCADNHSCARAYVARRMAEVYEMGNQP